jgi:hypothetical protein
VERRLCDEVVHVVIVGNLTNGCCHWYRIQYSHLMFARLDTEVFAVRVGWHLYPFDSFSKCFDYLSNTECTVAGGAADVRQTRQVITACAVALFMLHKPNCTSRKHYMSRSFLDSALRHLASSQMEVLLRMYWPDATLVYETPGIGQFAVLVDITLIIFSSIHRIAYMKRA